MSDSNVTVTIDVATEAIVDNEKLAALMAERDRLYRFVAWVADHRLVPGLYADDDHPYVEWITPDESEMDFTEVHERAKEVLDV